ncbi:hypothetical protein [Pararobbsia silviterrae]|uniref:Uncharacterized protein n=1 Tax=Pararobbsia silviterrae TaxID=1792498 RepID=A0A494X2U5_9BURK|nr:hypothetical protein [Pararobbsia silviterrae]RKP44660.1 hypothetical protein D7S86_26890 [Pararobbsia silviterrae]
MDASTLAAALSGAQMGDEISREKEAEAKAHGLVVVFGASDDLMELRGAIHDEVSCYDGGEAYFTALGLLTNECEDDDCPHFAKLKDAAAVVEAVWSEGEYSWVYRTDIPHATFEVLEDGEKYCRGIVFHLDHVRHAMKNLSNTEQL